MGLVRQCASHPPAVLRCFSLIFVIPMAGESRRFRAAGYERPKYELVLHGRPAFDHALNSFVSYFETAPFLFVIRAAAADFVRERCRILRIRNPLIVPLDQGTSGQAESVLRGIDAAAVPDGESITIFNIDTFRPGYRSPEFACDGYIEVFHGQGSGWSFVAAHVSRVFGVSETAEKLPISNLCCTGIYQFGAASEFRWAYDNPARARSDAERTERYVAPLYNPLIARGRDIRYGLIAAKDVIFCGTPEQYRHCQDSAEIRSRLGTAS